MAEIIKMPKLSDTMEEGVVAKWHKQVGDQVDDGELLADIETDKATMEFESFQSGTILHHGVEEGSSAKVDAILAIVGEEGEDISSLLAEDEQEAEEEEAAEKEKPTKEATESAEKIDTSGIKAKIIKMPKLSDTMKEGTVASWVKQVGDQVESGEILAEIETDKATMEFESFEDGELLYQGVKEGDSAPVDSVLAVVGEKGADYESLIKAFEQDNTGDSGEEPKADTDDKAEAIAEQPTKAEPEASETKPTSSGQSDGRVKISPLAKKMAQEKGIDPNTIKGSGTDGRIIKRDVENYKAPAKTAAASSAALTAEESYEEVPVSQMRKTIAKRLGESKFTAPHFYLTIDLNMDQAIEARKAINAMPDTKVSYNDMVVRSAAEALTKHPAVNSSWLGDTIRINKHVHVGVAVAVDEGLLVPVVRHANTKKLSAISAEVKEYAQRARDKKLQPEDWEGSTFSISNLGMFGIEEFTAIVNPPNACILAVGAIRQEPVVENGEVKVGNRMKVTLSCDHRVVDGATGSEFLQTFRTFIENPITILG